MKNPFNYFGVKSRFYFALIFILISAVSITGPLFSFDDKYHGTQIILHPFDVTKDVIKDRTYAIVLDGGSTGTRIHIFSFLINQDVKQRKIILDNEIFFHTNPGLSSYAHNASEAAISLEPLLSKAYEIVPSSLMSRTPVILKATAGLRLLSYDSATRILETVESKLRSLPYKVDDGTVSMLDETDEGLFAWYTVNFLLNKLHNISESIATLDLGGGSTQVTFSTDDVYTLVTSPPDYIVKRHIEGEPEYIYSHSYLGNGLMSARQSILLKNYSLTDQVSTDQSLSHTLFVKNPCFKNLGNQTYSWRFNRMQFDIGYDYSISNSYEQCILEAQKFIDFSNIDKPEELVHRKVYAMSYFYDRMKDIRVIKQEFGYVKVRDYFLYAENVCNGVIKLRKQSPFLCLDLVYIATYLHNGLGLPLLKDILLVKKINGIETSWALGAAINMFDFS